MWRIDKMISTKLHWIPAHAPGKLAISARPRGGDWLEEEMFAWQALGINVVVSLLEPDEQNDLDLAAEGDVARMYGLNFISLPIPDRGIPSYRTKPQALLSDLRHLVQSGQSIVIHCRQGVGRAGMVAASLLTSFGFEPEDAIEAVSAARGVPVPETREQRDWIQSASTYRVA